MSIFGSRHAKNKVKGNRRRTKKKGVSFLWGFGKYSKHSFFGSGASVVRLSVVGARAHNDFFIFNI